MAEIALKVAQIKDLTPSIKMFEFAAAAGGDLPRFAAGSHIDIITGNGPRSYSLANNPNERHRYVTAVLKEFPGRGGSRWMHETLKVGDIVASTEPIQNFPLNERAEKSLLLGGGIGITPLLAMSYRLQEIGADFQLHYCTRAPEATAFLDEIKALLGDRVTLYHDEGDISKGIDLQEVFGSRPHNAHLYVCGPSGLLRAAKDVVSQWPEETVHYELFASALSAEERAAAATHPNEEFEVELAPSGVILTIPAECSILDVLMACDYGVPYACEEGWCGACTIGLLAGKADHRDEFLSDADKAANNKIQICVSRALPGEKLVLDDSLLEPPGAQPSGGSFQEEKI